MQYLTLKINTELWFNQSLEIKNIQHCLSEPLKQSNVLITKTQVMAGTKFCYPKHMPTSDQTVVRETEISALFMLLQYGMDAASNFKMKIKIWFNFLVLS